MTEAKTLHAQLDDETAEAVAAWVRGGMGVRGEEGLNLRKTEREGEGKEQGGS